MPSHANILSNKVDANPPKAKKIQLFLIDLSKSVDQSTLLSGIENLRQNVSQVYPLTGDGIKAPASSYVWWFPILGSRDSKSFRPLFSNTHDLGIWNAVRANVKGKTNQTIALNKLRSPNGGWAQVLREKNFSATRCLSTVSKNLASPGVSGRSLQQLSIEVCRQARLVQNEFKTLEDSIAFYGSGRQSTSGGTDIFGSINRLKQEFESNQFKSFSKIEITFVSDMVHNTARKLKDELLQSPERACSTGKADASAIGLKLNSFYEIKIFGIGERRTEKQGKATEQLRIPLENYWRCYWISSGVTPKFGQLDRLGQD